MPENNTYEALLQRKLNRVSNAVDKRQGSIIYDALAPNSAETAQVYIDLQTVENRTYADTATGIDLTRRAAERGVFRYHATKAIRKGVFKGRDNIPFNPPLGSRFSGENLNYVVKDKITDGEFRFECEVAGAIGNRYVGQLIPIEQIDGLVYAELTDILIPGEDEEGDEHLRVRYYDSLESQAFGGNIADYKAKTNAITGVGGTKVYPVWNGGGTVKLVIIDSDFNVPSPGLIDYVQTEVDPEQNQGQGLGLAPIGHVVTVVGVTEVVINIETNITLQDGYTWATVEPDILTTIDDYLAELRKSWAKNETLIIRTSYIDTRILSVIGVLDVQDTKINGVAKNLILADTEIPVLGEVAPV